MNQLALPLQWPDGPAAGDFIVTPANADAVKLLDHRATWPVMAALLVGPRKSGRSLLGRIFAARSGADVIDNADTLPEASLFHAWNLAQETRRPLLIVADQPPPAWRPTLADLASRLSASPVARIDEPDDTLMAALLERQFAIRGVEARRDVIDWLVARLDRTYVTALRAVDVLDTSMLERHRRLTIPFARSTLAAAALIAQ